MDDAIHSNGLSRRFGRVAAVEGLDLRVPPGRISAFLGPNGAGKTTTIRLLLGLLRPHAGTCEVLGHPPGHPAALAQLGALVESPSLYPHLTGLENVEITRILRDLPRSETDRVLAQVGLAQDAQRQVRTYSLGMKQRLGMALALLGHPRLLLLDEPTNGLDPVGIQEMRTLIRTLPRETGVTVFLSSHLLAEVEQTADHLVVIHRGRLRYQGPLDAFGGMATPRLRVRVGDQARALALLTCAGFASTPGEDGIEVRAEATRAPEVARILVGAGLDLQALAPVQSRLEERFLALVEGE
ncbi:MAG TPA: ATP-binding cassette domain-containing protein [Holophagaceae bacterium]